MLALVVRVCFLSSLYIYYFCSDICSTYLAMHAIYAASSESEQMLRDSLFYMPSLGNS